MSWSLGVSPVPSDSFPVALENLAYPPSYPTDDEVLTVAQNEQVDAVKALVKDAAAVVEATMQEGSTIGASLSGHINKPGTTSHIGNSISVSVYAVPPSPKQLENERLLAEAEAANAENAAPAPEE